MIITEGGARSNATKMTRKKLMDIPVPTTLKKWDAKGRPKNSYWKPVQHGELATLVVGSLIDMGVDIIDENWITCREEMGLIGDIEVMPQVSSDWTQGISTYGDFAAEQMGMHILVRHSNDAVWSLDFLAAAKILVCANGMIVTKFGSITVKRRHSDQLELPEYVHDSIQAVCNNFSDIIKTKHQLQSIPISKPEGDFLAVEAARRKIMPWAMIKPVTEEWRNPTHSEFVDNNCWSLYNGMTEVAKKRSPTDQIDMIRESGNLLIEYGKKSGRLQLEV